MSTSAGDFGEQGDYATDDQLESSLNAAGLGSDEPDDAGESGVEDDTLPLPREAGKLLSERDPGRVFKAIDDIVQRQERLARNREEKKRHWDKVREGEPFAYLEHNEDRSIFKATVAPGVDADATGSAIPNKMDDLCNKVISQLLADDFLPDPKPDGDADSDRGAADLGKKFLRADGQTSGTDDRQLLRDALNSNITGAAEAVFVWVDPTAGGWRPMQIMAHPRAEDATKPLYAPMLDTATGMPILAAGPDGVPAPILEKASQPVLRYVATAKGARIFVEDATQADRQWLPKHRRKMLSINQVRCVPQSASVFDASSITLLLYDTLGEAKKRFQTLRTMRPAELKTLCQWRPRRWKSIVPDAHRPKDNEGMGAVTDDTLLFWYEHFCPSAPDYPDGAQVCVTGHGKGSSGQTTDGTVLLRDTLRDDVEIEDGVKTPILRVPPVSVFVCVNDIRDRDPLGSALMARFGGGKDAHDQIWAGMFDAMYKALNPNCYIPGTSTVTKEDVNRRDGTPIEILTKDDRPEWETPPELPTYVPQLLEQLNQSFNSAAGTNETSNGLDSQYAVSGVAKEVAIKTARVALAQYWQNTVKGLTYYWRIKLQLAQAKLTVPQMVRLSGVESAYKQPWFVGADMCGVSEVALQAGSGSMMTPTEKAQHLGFLQQNQWLDPEQAGELARASMQDDLGLPPNIHEEAVNRDIAAWSKGPPPGWMEQMQTFLQQKAAYDQALAQATQIEQVTDPATAAANPAAVQQMAAQQVEASGLATPQAPAVPFEDRPCHQEQLIATYRHRAFSRMMDTVEYTKMPPLWRIPFDERYEQARVAAGVTTVAEQQQAQAQAIQQQAQGAAKEQDGKAQTAEADRQFKATEADKDRTADAEQHARTLMSKESAGAQKLAGGAGQQRAGATKLPLRSGATAGRKAPA